MASDSDEILARQAQQGNKEAFFTLYNRYLKKVYNRVRSSVPLEECEDVTQDIFIAVVRALPYFEQRSRFNSWLYTIVNRQIAEFYRRREKQLKTSELGEEESDRFQASLLDDQIVLQQALVGLPDNYREIILLRFAEGLTFAEIAAQRGQHLEAVKSLYQRAISALRDRVLRVQEGKV